jgi:hypothetical protein
MKYIIYKQDSGELALLIPSQDVLQNYTINQIGVKDVPEGKPFKIVDKSDLPIDEPIELWTIDNADLTDGIGGESYEFEPKEDAVIEQGGDV